jgi:predicted phage terminase large subunit-like protein
MDAFKLTARQEKANELLASSATHIMLAGGSRSGKTFLILRAQVIRRLKAPDSRGAVLRFRFGHVKQSVIHDTFPKMMKLCFPQVGYELNRSDWFAIFPNGSELWFGGLDDKERTEKILGSEYADIFLNECSQIPYSSRNMAVTRLAQRVTDTVNKRPLSLKMYYDENPPDKGHWTYRMFKTKVDPETRNPLPVPDDYGFMQMNPQDNQQNLSDDYLRSLEALPARMRRRFLEGEFREMAPNALFVDEVIDRWRVVDTELPEMLRLVVAVDPSGAEDEDNTDNDEIGIMVAGLGTDGNAYVLEDVSCKAGPATWGRIATQAYERHSADRVVGEVNFGGAMVRHVIHTSRPRTPYRALTASRGKVVRAEPVSSLCESGKVRLAGFFPQLEEELYGFTTHGYMGERSPNRADAMIWAISDLFPDLLKHEDKPPVTVLPPPVRRGDGAWMRT